MSKISRIEIDFPIPVDFGGLQLNVIRAVLDDICKKNCPQGYVMWPAGEGSKITYMPMTAEEEKTRGMEFDDDVYHFEVSMRERHPDEFGHSRENKRRPTNAH